MEVRIAEVSDQRPILVAAGFVTVGLALKAAVFPLHVWLPNAYTFAPHMVTAFFAACSTKVAIYVLMRFDFFVFQANLAGHVDQFAVFLLPLALLGILVGSAVAMVEKDLKRLLAWSSVAQIGYILLGAGFSSEAGLTASVAHMFNHALAKGALFLAVAGFGMYAGRLLLQDIGGVGRRMPWTTAALVIAGASLVGIPGTAGFISKWLLLQAAFQQGALGMVAIVVVVLSSLAAVYYVWRIVEQAYFGEAPEGAVAGEAPWALLAGLWLVAIANIYFGLVPQLPLSLAETAAGNLLGLLSR
jgi:multicomponent Na+:H+ antiporter subunit D